MLVSEGLEVFDRFERFGGGRRAISLYRNLHARHIAQP
jgi:hypothetical protein